MAPPAKHVVFDVVGTCVSYQVFIDAIDSQLGERLRKEGVKPQLLGFAWMEAAEREYTYLAISGRYLPFSVVQRSLFYRILYMAGIAEPRKFATDEDLEVLMQAYMGLELRPGLAEAFGKLRAAGWTVWRLTAGDRKRVKGYFDRAGLDMPEENFMTCDDSKFGKPDPAAYRPALAKFAEHDERWFAAAHMWDASAAKSVGFKAAYCSVWEKESCIDLFGEMDVMAETPLEMVEKLIAVTGG